jgi:hypothetical protein
MPDRPDYRPIETTYAQAAFFASLMVPVIAAIGFCGRLGFSDDSPWMWARFVGLSWFLIHFSYAARKIVRTSGDPFLAPWWQGHPALTIAGLGIVTACGVEQAGVTRVVVTVFATLGAAALVMRTVEFSGSLRTLRFGALGVFGLLMGLYAAGSIWGGAFENLLFIENICNGYAHIDTLFHITLANMLRTYGACSTGLDGLPHVLYHFGSHWIFARFSNLLDLSVVDFYNLAYAVIFAPFITFSVLTFAVSIAELWRGPGRPPLPLDDAVTALKGRKIESLPAAPVALDEGFRGAGILFWFVLAAGVIGLLPLGSGLDTVARAAPIYASESYGLAIAVALLGIAAVSSLSRDIATAPEMQSIDVLLGFLFICTLPAVVGLLKISVMMLLSAAAVWFFFRLRMYHCKITAPSSVIGLIMLYCGFLFTYNPEYGQLSAIAPFNSLRTLVSFTWWSYYWLFCYVWTLAFVVLRLREEGVATSRQLVNAFRERRLLDVEFVLIIAILGSVPEILLRDYSSTHYFADDQQWLALGLTLAVVLRPVRSGLRQSAPRVAETSPVRARVQAAGDGPAGSWLDRVALSHALAWLLGLFAAGTILLNTWALLMGVANSVKGSLQLAASETSPFDAAWGGNFHQARQILDRQVGVMEEHLHTDKNIITVLRDLDRLPLAEKRRSFLFIPKTNRQFWDLLHAPYSPKDGPFVAPALSGIAMLDGLYDRPEGDSWSGYGYQHYTYPFEKQKQPPLDQYLPTLKQRCAELGMNQLIVIVEQNGRSEVRKFDCP